MRSSFYCAVCIILQIIVVGFLLFQAYLYWQMGSQLTKPVDENAAIANLIRNTIEDNCVVIYSKTHCPYSRRTKELFKTLDVPFEVVELDKQANSTIYQDVLQDMTGERTVPRVFVNGKFIGGSDLTHQLHQEKKLQKLINACNQHDFFQK